MSYLPGRPVPLELAHQPVKYRKARYHKNVTRSSQTVRATRRQDSDDEPIHVESVEVFSSTPDFFQNPVTGDTSITAVLRSPTTYSQVQQ